MAELTDVLAALQRHIDKAGSLRALARKWKVSAAYLSDVRAKRRAPGPSILPHLGFTVKRQWVTTYARVK